MADAAFTTLATACPNQPVPHAELPDEAVVRRFTMPAQPLPIEA